MDNNISQFIIIGCFVFIISVLSFTFSYGTGIIMSALFLEIFSKTSFKNHDGAW
jgi:hypothetical protein